MQNLPGKPSNQGQRLLHPGPPYPGGSGGGPQTSPHTGRRFLSPETPFGNRSCRSFPMPALCALGVSPRKISAFPEGIYNFGAPRGSLFGRGRSGKNESLGRKLLGGTTQGFGDRGSCALLWGRAQRAKGVFGLNHPALALSENQTGSLTLSRGTDHGALLSSLCEGSCPI